MDNKITVKTQLTFAFFQFCSVMAVTIPMMYLTFYLTESVGMSAALMGTVLLIARIVDFIIGLVSGGVVEKSRMRWGTYRSWLIILKYVVFIGVCLQFWNTSSLPPVARGAVTIIGYIMMHGSMNFVSLAQYGLIQRRAGSDMNGRAKLSIAYARGMTVANIIISAVALPAVIWIGGFFPGYDYLITAAFFALFFFIGSTVLVKATEEYDRVVTEEEAKKIPQISFKDMVKTAAGNGQLMLVLLAFCLTYIGMFIVQTIMQYYFVFIIGNQLMMSVSLTASMVFAFVGSIFGPIFGQKAGKKAALVTGMLLWGVFSALITFLAKGNVWIYIVLGGLGQVAFYMFFSFGMNYFLDAGEYGFYKTGKDNRNVALAMYNMPMKVGMGLGGAIGSFGLAFIGYTSGMTQVTDAFVDKFMMLTGIVPAVFMFASGLLILFFWKITDADAQKYATANAEKLAAMAAQTSDEKAS
ncbi:MFS transporter [Alkalibacter rhizosphaerae]|uniref:MFS transporter n=1 Tax=Alkalibacter rhizosphaerae TaxID=2815577 RepID=A0A974XE92_9FIRM|nr:MFS transporter [Alkalibacter rhizosphaerae]QSX08249.1 MFS transporter [Alkalibacter rhizosphaerae]